ncbi:Sulfate/thiosulfate import ATP-binding protein [Hirschfeldia incana]|nr:Sulfate/thiosulfate import ATP-binding protein [Hirschfeldia incana]
MAIFSKTKSVTDPLDDETKARILSNHSSILDQDSPEICELEFLDDGLEDGVQTFYDSDSDLSENSPTERSGEVSGKILKTALSLSDYDLYRNTLLAHVSKAAEAYSSFRSKRKHVFRDKVASFLRELGHNAAVCVSRWSSSSNLTAGSYDIIDVLYNPNPPGDYNKPAVRYFVDLDFASEFEIARPTSQYARSVLRLLPRVFVGKEKNLRTVVRESCDAAKRSLKSRGLSLPPWRRFSYLQRKWFGPCTRRVVGSSFETAPFNKDAVSCRSVGFDDAVNARLFIRT